MQNLAQKHHSRVMHNKFQYIELFRHESLVWQLDRPHRCFVCLYERSLSEENNTNIVVIEHNWNSQNSLI